MDDELRILIIDDHSLVRAGTKLALQNLNKEIIAYEAESFSEAMIVLSKQTDLDLVLLDINLPDKSGFLILQYIKKSLSLVPTVIISASDNSSDIYTAIENGARGFIHKSEDEEIMINALKLVLSGGKYIPPTLISGIKTQKNINQSDPSEISLTPRQQQVLTLISQGKPNKMIADHLGCTESTVRVHVTAIFKALGVSNRTEAAARARNNALFE
jgi:DNA-binding NarL/FixJ family response regulator